MQHGSVDDPSSHRTLGGRMGNRIKVALKSASTICSWPVLSSLWTCLTHPTRCALADRHIAPVQVGLEERFRAPTAAVCATRSLIAGTPNGLCFRPAWVSTPAVRAAVDTFTFQLLHSSSQPLLHPVLFDVLNVWPSTPAAPRSLAAFIGRNTKTSPRYTLSYRA